MTKRCSANGCDRPHHAHGYCGMHNWRVQKYGNTETLLRGKKGLGWVSSGGYHLKCKNGVVKQEHVLIAEAALGHELPPKALVHHVDGNRLNNAHDNLVICPDDAYHALLHRRMRALDACGHAHWRKCQYCKQFDDPENLGSTGRHNYHSACKAKDVRERRATNRKAA